MHAGFGALRELCTMNCGVRVRIHESSPALARDLARLDGLWTEGLARFGGPFLAGAAFTAVDAMYAPIAFRIQTYGLELGEAAASYARRLLALPGMQAWYAAGLAETWREPMHEADLRRCGVIVEDLRAT
jgi:glutathione S-transferase